LTRFNQNLKTVDPRRTWWSFALECPLVFHSTMALAAAYWVAALPDPDPCIRQEIYRQKVLAIERIEKNLMRSSITNWVLAGVACLANVEVRWS
jgi:hypothetical protein